MPARRIEADSEKYPGPSLFRYCLALHDLDVSLCITGYGTPSDFSLLSFSRSFPPSLIAFLPIPGRTKAEETLKVMGDRKTYKLDLEDSQCFDYSIYPFSLRLLFTSPLLLPPLLQLFRQRVKELRWTVSHDRFVFHA